MKEVMQNIWKWFDGNKTTIGAIALMTVNSAYIEELITNPNLYTLAQGIAGIFFGVGLFHKAKKAMNK